MKNGFSGRTVGQRSGCLTVLPVLHSLKLCFPEAALATNVCPAWRVLTSESVKAVKACVSLGMGLTIGKVRSTRVAYGL